jgi:beta-aspartyl-peptidase (threonine type)
LRRNNLPIPEKPEGAIDAASNDPSPDDHQFGTVGVVAYDSRGNIAAGTSTGGMTGKRWGRVGDSPVIGAGTYAQNGVCGVSATGSGEYFIRAGVARAICARMELNRDDADDAANRVMREVADMGGDGGVIVLDGRGRYAWVMNTPGMYRGYLRRGGYPLVQIFADEED